VLTVGIFIVFLAGFIPVYDYLELKNPYYIGIEQFFTNEKAVNNYLDTHSGVGAKHDTGRIDAIVVPLKRLSNDPVATRLRTGIRQRLPFLPRTTIHRRIFSPLRGVSGLVIQLFLLEIGIFGTALVFVLYWLIFRDSLAVARSDDSLTGSIALAGAESPCW